MSGVNSQGFGSSSRVCKGLDEENAIFLLHAEKCFWFVRVNGGFSARALFCYGFLPRWKKNCFAQSRRDAEEKAGWWIFRSKKLCVSARDWWRMSLPLIFICSHIWPQRWSSLLKTLPSFFMRLSEATTQPFLDALVSKLLSYLSNGPKKAWAIA